MDLIVLFFLQAPEEWNPGTECRVWKLKAPAYGLNDAPVAFHRSLKKHLMNKTLSMESVGLHCEGSTFDPCLFFVFNGKGPAAGALTTHIDGILGCGEPGVMEKLRQFLEIRFGRSSCKKNTLFMWVWTCRRMTPFRFR